VEHQSASAPRRRPRFRPHAGFVAVNALFAAVFVWVALSAFHAPSPHRLPVGIVATAAVTGQVEQALGTADPGGFDLRVYGGEAAARAGIAHAEVDGALIASPGHLRLLVARGGGAAPAQALTAAIGAVATRSGLPLTVTDVAPPLPGDSMALSPFFVILGVLFPSLAAGSASALVFRRTRPAWAVAAPVVVAVVAGLAAAGIADGVAGLGHYAAIAGIVALFSLAVSAPTAALGRIRPPLAGLAVLAFVVLGLPVSGGPSVLGAFGPGFLRALHPALPLGAAASAVRGTVYFDGYGVAGPLWALAAWAIAGTAALALVATWRRRTATGALGSRTVTVGRHAAPAAAGPGPVLPVGAVTEVVVGFDNSGPARRALSQAVALAAAGPASLHVVYADHVIIDSDLSGFGHAEMAESRDQEAAAVAGAAAEIVDPAGLRYTFERRQAAPADAILAAAGALTGTADGGPVIVVGRSGHTARHLLGSVPAHLLHHSPYPVLTIP
jgi:nucleotide-binding universal stress UspA family protein